MTGYRWVEYGVALHCGIVASASTAEIAQGYAHGRPVSRAVLCTPVDKTGNAAVDIGPWVPLAGAA